MAGTQLSRRIRRSLEDPSFAEDKQKEILIYIAPQRLVASNQDTMQAKYETETADGEEICPERN